MNSTLELINLCTLIFYSRYANSVSQARAKPGREIVTFLLICNLAMWAVNSLETNRADLDPVLVRKYF